MRQRLIDSVEICFRENNGEVVLEALESPVKPPHRFSEAFECKTCGIRYEDPEPRLFSFNSPFGACPRCQGFGNTIDLDMDLVIPDKNLSLNQGAIEPWTKPRYRVSGRIQEERAGRLASGWTFRFASLEPERNTRSSWMRFDTFFDYLETKKYKLHVRVFLSRYRGYSVCPDCNGSRLRQEARNIYHSTAKNIADVVAMTIQAGAEFFSTIHLTESQTTIAERILWEIRSRLRFLNDVGLQYLTLDRLASTLSGGEAQRIQLATSLGSSLVGALYVLDEPSIGLHPRDAQRLIQILLRLRDIGNTVLVVEHDAEIMRAADHILDLGPGAGENGGHLVYQGSIEGLRAQHGFAHRQVSVRRTAGPHPEGTAKPTAKAIQLTGASRHNLKNVTIEIPVGLMTCITGVSGSGKSTLVHECLYEVMKAAMNNARAGARSRNTRKRTEMDRRCRSRRSEPDRPDAPIQSRYIHQSVRSDPRGVCSPRAKLRRADTTREASRSIFPADAAKSARATEP